MNDEDPHVPPLVTEARKHAGIVADAVRGLEPAIAALVDRAQQLRHAADALPELFASVETLSAKAFHSRLSALPNQNAFESVAEVYNRKLEAKAAVVFADLTGFKNINDTHGEKAGDMCIREAGERLGPLSRDCGGVAFHVSGDEFVLLIPPPAVQPFESDFVAKLAEFELHYQGKALRVRANAGIALPDLESGLEELRMRAEKACKHAKRIGQAVLVWSPDIASSEAETVRWRCVRCHAQIVVTTALGRNASAASCPLCAEPRIQPQ